MKTSISQLRILGLFLLLTLTACGGDDGGSNGGGPTDTSGTLVVWARSADASFGTPVTVFVGNEQVGQLTANAPASQSGPTGTAGATELRLTRQPGTYRIRAVSAGGQVWVSNVTVTTGQVTAQLLENNASNVGRVTFWWQSGGTVNSPVTVILDVNDTLGTLNSSVAAAPTCGAMGTATGLRPAGTYAYRAINQAGNCTWTGSFTVAGNNACQLVQLNACSN